MSILYLLRHGEIESDGIRRFLGQTDVRLNSRGIEQARMWQRDFSETPFEGIYASDLSRCVETARIIAGSADSGVHYLPDLREINLGMLEGLAMHEVREQFPAIWKQRGKNISRYVPEGGESFEELRNRVVPALEKICFSRDGNILIVSHAGVNRVFLCHILGIPLSDLFQIKQHYGCLNLLETDIDSFRIIGMNLNALP